MRQTRECPALIFWNLRMQLRESPHVRFVNNRAIPGTLVARGSVFPLESRIHHHAFRHKGRAVAPVEAQVRILGSNGVTENGRVPPQLPDMRASIRIEQ